jgi:Tol biopolymer transport system component
MEIRWQVAMVSAAAALCALLMLAPAPGLGQAPLDPQVKAAAKAALVKAQAATKAGLLTLYNRQGDVVRTLGERANYDSPALSPDGKRLAVSKTDETTQIANIWVFDLATGASTQITSDSVNALSPVWSPDGSQIVYASVQAASLGLYRIAANGTGNAELLYQLPGNGIGFVTSWSADGRFLSFSAGNPPNLYVLALAGGPENRKAIEVVPRGVYGRFSPDGRFLSYVSTQSGRAEIWVRLFDPSAPGGTAPAAGPWQISEQGTQGLPRWREDGKELYYLARGGAVMAVEISTNPAFRLGKPIRLFTAPTFTARGASISRDGQQFWFAVPPQPRGAPFPTQITVFDRQGKVVRALGEPGEVNEPMLSPDGTRLAALTDQASIRVFDVSSGNSTPVVTPSVGGRDYDSSPTWSPDGRQIAFFSYRESLGRVYRSASDGTGREELLYTHAPFLYSPPLTDWSPDGRFLSFSAGGVPWVLPLNGERKATELMREEYNVYGLRFSPDSRYVAYVSDESGRNEVYVRPFDSSRSALGAAKWQVTKDGGLGFITWRRDGRELLYLARDGGVMAVDVTTTPVFQAGTPQLLFRAPGTFGLVGVFGRGDGTNDPDCSLNNPATCEQGSISRDGQRFAFNVPLPPQRTEFRVAPAILAQYAGVYSDRVVTLEGNQLMIQPQGREKFPLFAESETRFFMKATYGDFEFVKDDQGAVKYLFFYRRDVGGGVPRQWIRQSPASAKP